MLSGILAIVVAAAHPICFGSLSPVDACSVLQRCKHPVSQLQYIHALRLLQTDPRCFAFVGVEAKHDVMSVSVCRPMDNVHVLHVCVVSKNIANNDQRQRKHILALKQWHSCTFKDFNLVLASN